MKLQLTLLPCDVCGCPADNHVLETGKCLAGPSTYFNKQLFAQVLRGQLEVNKRCMLPGDSITVNFSFTLE